MNAITLASGKYKYGSHNITHNNIVAQVTHGRSIQTRVLMSNNGSIARPLYAGAAETAAGSAGAAAAASPSRSSHHTGA